MPWLVVDGDAALVFESSRLCRHSSFFF